MATAQAVVPQPASAFRDSVGVSTHIVYYDTLLGRYGLDFYIAAVRECFEESGLLFARGERPALVDLDGSEQPDAGTPLADERVLGQVGEGLPHDLGWSADGEVGGDDLAHVSATAHREPARTG